MDLIRNTGVSFADALVPTACRRVTLDRVGSLLDNPVVPVSGSLALAEVLTPGANALLSRADGGYQRLVRGQSLLVALGAPYAPLSHTGRLPTELGECDLLNANGVAGIEVARAAKLAAPTRLRLMGLLGTACGAALNLSDFALPLPRQARFPTQSLLLASTARRTKASPTLRHLVQALSARGAVAAIKLTGELDAEFSAQLHEAGAAQVFDSVDAGHSSTGGLKGPALLAMADQLLAQAAAAGADIAITRLAGGLAQPEVRALLSTPGFAQRFDGVVLSAADALSARAGVRLFESLGLPVRLVSGALCDSPLAMREAQPLSCPVVPPEAIREALAWGVPAAVPSLAHAA